VLGRLRSLVVSLVLSLSLAYTMLHFLLDVDGGRVANNHLGVLGGTYHGVLVFLLAVFLALSRWLMEVTQLVVTMRVFSTDTSGATTADTTTAAAGAPRPATMSTSAPHLAGAAAATTTDDGPEIIIVGAGIVGASLASALGQDNRRVMLIERDLSEPDRIVGELLQPGGVAQLTKMNLGDCLEGIDSASIHGYSIFWRDERVQLTYPQSADGTPLRGRSFHHGRFIMNLRRAAAKQPTVQVVEGTVTELLEEGDEVRGVVFKRKDTGQVSEARAPLVVVCDGLFSRFRKQLVSEPLHSRSSFVGMVLKDLELPFPNHGHVVLAKPSPVLLYPISSTETRILVDVPAPMPSDLREYLLRVTAPQLPDHTRASFEQALHSGAPLRSMPAGRMHPEPLNKRGVLLLGDAFNVRNPLTGGGMAVAFTDCNIVRSILQQVPDLSDRDRLHDLIAKRFYSERRSSVAITNVLAQALYEVFSASLDPVMAGMQEACFRYFLLGDRFTHGPMSMLSCVCHSPLTLVYHFFSVGFYSMGRSLLPFPTPARIRDAVRLGYLSAQILLPLLWNEHLLSPLYPRFPAPPKTTAADTATATVAAH